MSRGTLIDQLRLSELAPRVLQSEIRAMSVACEAAGGVNLAQGVCDTEVPAVVAEGAHRAIRDGHNTYTRMEGIARLRSAIAAQVARTHGIDVDPEREIIITNGVTGGLQATVMALLDPGDEVIVFEPFYGYHLSTLAAVRAIPVIVGLSGEDWHLDLSAVRAAITPKTRAILVNTPSNPAGKVFTRTELESLAELSEEFGLFLFSDEIYEHFLYDGAKHVSPISLPGMRERTILMSGFSKTFSVTGWRIGYLIASPKWIGSIGYFHDLTYVCATAPFQHACADGVEQLPLSFYENLASEHSVKRSMLLEALSEAGLTPHVPSGAYYILADASSLEGRTAAEKARTLLRETGVASVSGSAFFRPGGGENLLRFCFAKKDADLADACRRLRARGRS